MASFRKRGKTWQYRVTYMDHNGERQEISKAGFRTKTEAKVAADKIEHELNSGINVQKGDMLFIDYYEEWIETYKIGAYSLETDRFYNDAVKIVNKYFKGVRLKEISRETYQQFLNDYSVGRAKETVRKAHTKIGAPLRDAFHNGHIPKNPAYRPTIRGADGVKESEKFLNEGEAKAVLEALLDDLQFNYISRYMLILQFATGMRISEVMGVTIKDLDFLHNRLDINKTWDYKFGQGFQPTKNKEERNISVDKDTMDIMKEFYDHQLSRKIVDSKGRLFAHKGKIPSINGINKTLRRACKRAGVNEVTSHALRHTHASILLLNGVSIAYISKRLGHKNISITSNTYSHVLDELEARDESETIDIFSTIYNL
ncbi:MAG: site-specific integrase [Alkalibacterium sp.]|nr:site-specific integrase [Alkalibacterium sp.]